MSAYEFEPGQAPSLDRAPDLSLIDGQAPEGAFFEIAAQLREVEPAKWPQILFKLKAEINPERQVSVDYIREGNIFGGVLGTNTENRLRSAVRTLQEVVPSLIELPPRLKKNDPSYQKPRTPAEVCKDTHEKLDKFFNKSTNNKTNSATTQKLFTQNDLLQIISDEYCATNHPVFQLLEEIAWRNEDRKAKLIEQPNCGISILSQKELEKLYDDLIIVAENPRIINRAGQELAARKTQLAARLAIDHTINPDEL